MICELGHDKTGMDILYSLCLYLFHCLLLLDLSSSALAVDSLHMPGILSVETPYMSQRSYLDSPLTV